MIEKTSNTEKLAGMIIKILKVLEFAFICWIVLMIAMFCIFSFFKKQSVPFEVKEVTLSCSIACNDYLITIGSDSYFNCSNCDKKIQIYLRDITNWTKLENSVKNIKKYFEDNGGECELQ